MFLLMNPAARAGVEEQFFQSLGEISKLFAAHLDLQISNGGFHEEHTPAAPFWSPS